MLRSLHLWRYFTHSSWTLLWPLTLLWLRIKNWNRPWRTFWRRHLFVLRSTAQMVQSQTLHVSPRDSQKSPIPYLLRTTCLITTALTIAGGSWYVAVDLTTASDLTAIYNCSAFFAYVFSIPLLHDKLRFDKIVSVGVAIIGVLIVSYGDGGSLKPGDSSVESVSRDLSNRAEQGDLPYRAIGNLIIGVGSMLYGLYEVVYKKLACPPEGTSPGRGMIFSQLLGSLIGAFTLLLLWIPLPLLHITGLETFELPRGETAWMLLISVLANAGWFPPFPIFPPPPKLTGFKNNNSHAK